MNLLFVVSIAEFVFVEVGAEIQFELGLVAELAEGLVVGLVYFVRLVPVGS